MVGIVRAKQGKNSVGTPVLKEITGLSGQKQDEMNRWPSNDARGGVKMDQTSKSASYYIYLLKLWPERSHDNGETLSWRYSIEDPITGLRKGFAELEDFLAYVQAQIVEIIATQASNSQQVTNER
jgi:hypothetical protein